MVMPTWRYILACLCVQACRKELRQQKAAYDRALAETLERQQSQKAGAAKEIAAEALRSHPLADTPPRAPHAAVHASPLQDGPVPRMPVLRSRYFLVANPQTGVRRLLCCTRACSKPLERIMLSTAMLPCSPLGERQRPRSASLQRLSSARRRPLEAASPVPAAEEAESQQQPPACQHHMVDRDGAGSVPYAHEQKALPTLDAHVQRSKVHTQLAASRGPAAKEHHALCSPSNVGTQIEARSPVERASARRAAAPGRAAPAASSAREAAMKSPFRAAQPPVAGTGTGTFTRQAIVAAQGSRCPVVEQAARHPFSKPQITGAA